MAGPVCAALPIGNFNAAEVNPTEEAYLFTPAGFTEPGKLKVAGGDQAAELRVTIRGARTQDPTPCRVNVVGADGNYYQPQENDLAPYGFTGNWPEEGARGNRPGKGPIRYYGWFFYTSGRFNVKVPPGAVRVEVWKGFEYRPRVLTTRVDAGDVRQVSLTIEQTLPAADYGYYAGDPHIHVPRRNNKEDQLVFDLMEAEGILYGSILCYNEPAGPYAGVMDQQDMPQRQGLGPRSLRTRGRYHILSGQEYRSTLYGHLNLYLNDKLVLPGQSVNADNFPIYGQLADETRRRGGLAVYAHGGYALEVYTDAVLEKIDAIELLQFSRYRGIGLDDWYRLLNAGFQVPVTGASDYPACRTLGDCKTYVYHSQRPDFQQWYRGMGRGTSFVSSGPFLLLEVDGKRPGASIHVAPDGPARATARARVISEVAPVTHVQLIVNGSVVRQLRVPRDAGQGHWIELQHTLPVTQSCWIAARAFSKAPTGSPDAEAHTNPVYVYVNGRAPYDQQSVDHLLKEIERQIAFHQSREFAEKSEVVAYFLQSRDRLQQIRGAGGRPAPGASAASDSVLSETHAGAVAGDPDQLARYLRPIPPKSPEEALATFTTAEGFHMELVAHEPLVVDPIAAAFDENGRLYVAEMRDYPYKPDREDKPIGRVRMLEDTDGDGRMDRSHIFADHLLWAGGIAPWRQGVFVASPPDIWYLKDTDGDHRADVRRKVYTGFGMQNQQGMLNNLKWGLDHKVYGSASVNGGDISAVDRPDAPPVSLAGHDFRFDPVSRRFEAITGRMQFGLTFDDWGNRFLCSQAQPLKHVVIEDRYLARNPFLPAVTPLKTLAPSPTPVFRISPIERWREIRSRRRIASNTRPATQSGVSHHVMDAAAGVTVYRGAAYPAQFYGNVFIGGAQNNLIHRRTLHRDGVSFTSHRADPGSEFVQSTDNWFRPVNFVNAPDGTLYVLDMSREILEAIHIPLDVVQHLDLRNGRDRGRIYRIAPDGFRVSSVPRLGTATVEELVRLLEHPSGWWRDTAHRLIYERQDSAAVEPLRQILAESQVPQARLAALWSLQGLHALRNEDILRVVADSAPPLREAAIRLAEARLDEAPEVLSALLARSDDHDPRVRFQLALTLGASEDPRAADVLVDYTKRFGQDTWMRTALLTSMAHSGDAMLAALLGDQQFMGSGDAATMLVPIARLVGTRNDPPANRSVLDTLARSGVDDHLQREIVRAMGEGLKRSGARLDIRAVPMSPGVRLVRAILADAKAVAADRQATADERRAAIRMLGCGPLDLGRSMLNRLLAADQPAGVQQAALSALGDYTAPDIAHDILARWSEFTPEMRTRAADIMLSRKSWALEILEAVSRERVAISHWNQEQRQRLLEHPVGAVRRRAKRLLRDRGTADRRGVVEYFRANMPDSGDASAGETTFQKHCAACHRIAGRGHAVGPDLTSVASLDVDALLVHILDPNDYVLPKYVQYMVLDAQGRIHTGMIASQTATSVTLVRDRQESRTVLRSHIDDMRGTDKSLMPEGFEEKISPPDMADLIAFLVETGRQPGAKHADDGHADDGQARRDFGTLPGLIEPDDESE